MSICSQVYRTCPKTHVRTHIYTHYRRLFLRLRAGRKGLPKRRLLQCNHAMTRLFWQPEPTAGDAANGVTMDLPSEAKSVLIDEIVCVRRGNEPDVPVGSKPPASGAAAAGGATGAPPPSALSKLLGSGAAKLGTSTLRRGNLSANDLALCVSLILPDRSVLKRWSA